MRVLALICLILFIIIIYLIQVLSEYKYKVKLLKNEVRVRKTFIEKLEEVRKNDYKKGDNT